MATKQQIPVLAARVVEFQGELEKLPIEDAQWVIQNTQEAISLWIEALENRGKSSTQSTTGVLSKAIAAIPISALTKEFVVKDKFKVSADKGTWTKISYIDKYFKAWFLEKIEKPHPGGVLCSHNIIKSCLDDAIFDELGGREKVVTTLSDVFSMIERRGSGEVGALLINGYANIFYVLDISGILRSVFVSWRGKGWDIKARLVGDSREWFAFNRVFLRKPQPA